MWLKESLESVFAGLIIMPSICSDCALLKLCPVWPAVLKLLAGVAGGEDGCP